MDVEELKDLVAAHFARRTTGAVRVDYVLNWGGFVNQSFRIDDGRRRCHLKLSDSAERQGQFKAWHRIDPDLSGRYHAPPVLEWVAIDDTEHQGLLFPHLDGEVLTHWPAVLRQAIGKTLKNLHHDQTLAEEAFAGQPSGSCEADYRGDFHERFVADLAMVREDRPAFVDPETFQWMIDQVHYLENQVASSAAFAEPATALIHGDLWPNNVLVSATGVWHLLDWDDHRLGDPVLDLAKLLDPASTTAPPEPEEIVATIGSDAAALARFEQYQRAILLDQVIDPLADYIDADQAPEHADRVRAGKRLEHLAARDRYRRLYR